MPVYEFECRDCMLTYNKEIDKLVKNLNKKYAEKLTKKNTNFKYIELLNPKNDKTIFSVGKEGNKGIRRFRYKLDEKKFLYLELTDFKFSELFFEGDSIEDISCPCDKNCKNIERIFSPFKAIFEKRDMVDNKNIFNNNDFLKNDYFPSKTTLVYDRDDKMNTSKKIDFDEVKLRYYCCNIL